MAKKQIQVEPSPVPLKDPILAGVLAWLLPGAGHLYQGRTGKGILFMVCLLGAFGYGVLLGGPQVVYASWGPTPNEKRLPYLCQIGIGVPALPALVQYKRQRDGRPPLFDNFMAAPDIAIGQHQGSPDGLDEVHKTYHRYYELGTVFTMVAGLLNVLVIYDAVAGPVYAREEKREIDRRAADAAKAQESSPSEPAPDTQSTT